MLRRRSNQSSVAEDEFASTGPAAGADTRRQYIRAEHAQYVLGASMGQICVVYVTLVLGLGWPGKAHDLAIDQSLWAFVPIFLLAVRPPWPMAVPLISALLTVVLLVIGGYLGDPVGA